MGKRKHFRSHFEEIQPIFQGLLDMVMKTFDLIRRRSNSEHTVCQQHLLLERTLPRINGTLLVVG
jgi:hypothetical protein